MSAAITIGVIGCGYWGPNLLRNFAENDGAQLSWMCDLDMKRLDTVGRRYPAARTTRDCRQLFNDPHLDAVVIATPVATHFNFARQALEAGKHVLIEKPFTTSAREAEQLIELAERKGLTLMVDHTFIYTGAVRKIREIVRGGELGELLYFDSVRINLGLFQPDINVVWDLAPHDLSIMDFIIGREPESVTATGRSHIEPGIENIAYVMFRFSDEFIAHFHFNWLAPVKIRRTLIAGSRKMIVYDDIEPTEKVRIYDKGVTTNRAGDDADKEDAYRTLVSYRTGDVWVPKLDSTEALHYVCKEFLDSIRERRCPLTDGHAGLRVVRLLEAAQQSITQGGRQMKL
ncbi:MAG TPA: Gfo/Idh/MocA family oxidoreductase [Pyrinomonadaceae bacterium]|jgi:predicted dehydrogenase|nr:Gfo/Idh/MocA family oxidoreductase [Pyrinomonadaceae bacterium]